MTSHQNDREDPKGCENEEIEGAVPDEDDEFRRKGLEKPYYQDCEDEGDGSTIPISYSMIGRDGGRTQEQAMRGG